MSGTSRENQHAERLLCIYMPIVPIDDQISSSKLITGLASVENHKLLQDKAHVEQRDPFVRTHSTPILPSSAKKVESASGKTAVISLSRPTAIELRPNITIISVVSNQGPVSSIVFFQDLFALIARYALPIILTATSLVSITLALPASDNLSAAISELEAFYVGCVNVESRNAIVTLIGEKLWDDAGLIGKCCNAIDNEGIDIQMISQGAAKGSISIVTEEEYGERAMMALRKKLLEE
ncbi:hypothetical protein ACLMJK_000717 [Lecanora helva]